VGKGSNGQEGEQDEPMGEDEHDAQRKGAEGKTKLEACL